ncbi:hypothetical protein FE772_23650 [Lysobacter enzymogenes]|nr:hypothetical protein [Lysobacter enzymogenes]QCW28193.1 hypothetical protein FE772_23650 [Lysobacter enzymogenes]
MAKEAASMDEAADVAERIARAPTENVARQMIEYARSVEPDGMLNIQTLTESIRFMPKDRQAEITQKISEMIPPEEAGYLRNALAKPDPFAEYRDAHRKGRNMAFAPEEAGVDVDISIKNGAGQEVSLTDGSYTQGAGPISKNLETGEVGVSVPTPIPGVEAKVGHGPGALPMDPNQTKVGVGVGVDAGDIGVEASVTVGLKRPSPGMDGAWIQTNEKGQAVMAGHAQRTSRTGQFGPIVETRVVGPDGTVTRADVEVESKKMAEALVNPAWTDGRATTGEKTPEQVQQEAVFKQLKEGIPPGDQALFNKLRVLAPAGTSYETVAEALLIAKHNGINDPKDLSDGYRDGNSWKLTGPKGDLELAILDAPKPDVADVLHRLKTDTFPPSQNPSAAAPATDSAKPEEGRQQAAAAAPAAATPTANASAVSNLLDGMLAGDRAALAAAREQPAGQDLRASAVAEADRQEAAQRAQTQAAPAPEMATESPAAPSRGGR